MSNSAASITAPMEVKKTEADRFKSRMTKYCVFPLSVNLTYRGATEELVIQEGLTVLCDGLPMDLFDYIKEYIRFYDWNEETESELESEPLTAKMAMELLTVAYYDWADYSLWDMYTRFPLYMAYASYTEEQWECRDRLSAIKPHSFPYWGKTVTLQENRLFSVDTYSHMTGADVIQYIRGKTVTERGAHRRLLHS